MQLQIILSTNKNGNFETFFTLGFSESSEDFHSSRKVPKANIIFLRKKFAKFGKLSLFC